MVDDLPAPSEMVEKRRARPERRGEEKDACSRRCALGVIPQEGEQVARPFKQLEFQHLVKHPLRTAEQQRKPEQKGHQRHDEKEDKRPRDRRRTVRRKRSVCRPSAAPCPFQFFSRLAIHRDSVCNIRSFLPFVLYFDERQNIFWLDSTFVKISKKDCSFLSPLFITPQYET